MTIANLEMKKKRRDEITFANTQYLSQSSQEKKKTKNKRNTFSIPNRLVILKEFRILAVAA